MICYLDANGQYIYTNKKYNEWLGVDEDTFIGKNFFEFFGKDTHPVLKNYIDQASNGELIDFEIDMHIWNRSNLISMQITLQPDKDEYGKIRGCLALLQDITERKNIQKKLQQNNTELQDYIDYAPISLHWVDSNGIIIWANKAELDMMGYAPDEYIGQSITRFHADPEKINDILYRLKNRETLHQYEAKLRCKDGSLRTVHINSNVLWQNGFVHTRCFTVDVTEKKMLFDSLRESEEKSRQLIEGLPVAVYTCDLEGRITRFNEAAVELWGRHPQIGKDKWCGSWKIFTPDGVPLSLDECPMAICIREKRSVIGDEIVIEQPDGRKRNVLPYPKPLLDSSGEMLGAVNTLVDITAIKQAGQALKESEKKYRDLAAGLEIQFQERTQDLIRKNEELRKSEERYHKMVDEVEDYAILLLDTSGIVQNWNKGAEKIKGYKEHEIVGKSFKAFYLSADRESGLPEKLMQEAMQKGKALHEGWRVRKDGSTFWGSIVLTAVHNENQEVVGFTKVTRDLTQRKLSEEKLKQYAQELEFQNKELEQFTYAASHDMKEPLRKIIFYNTFINEGSANVLPDKERAYLNRSLNSAMRMQRLIDDLLAYSRIALQSQNFVPVDLNTLMQEIIAERSDTLEEHDAVLQTGQLPVINGIYFQMKQLFDNLVGNAIKYRHPERRLHIRITSEKIKGSRFMEKENPPYKSYHKISVIDNGIGFDPTQAEKIFELFQRLGIKTDSSGTGIGLTICRKIVQNHKGFIEAEGKLNEGAGFYIYLPNDG